MGNQTPHAQVLCHGVGQWGFRDVNLVDWLCTVCVGGGGAKSAISDLRGVPADLLLHVPQ